MTLRIYAERKGLALDQIRVEVSHNKVHAKDCLECEGREGRVYRFERRIMIDGGTPQELEMNILEIADKGLVHRTLASCSIIITLFTDGSGR